jgi:NAD(P)-dependent dehydrogenase (short-subunit alcohol dehydrogenase family)
LTETALPTHPPLAGQVAVITGAARGIGRAIALTLAELGAHTVLCGRSREALEQTAAAIQNSGGRSSGKSSTKNSEHSSEHSFMKSSAIECDVTDLHSVEALAEHVERPFHRIDI